MGNVCENNTMMEIPPRLFSRPLDSSSSVYELSSISGSTGRLVIYGELVQDGYALCFIFILLGHKNSLA